MNLTLSRAAFITLAPMPFVYWLGDVASAIYVLAIFIVSLLYRLNVGTVSRDAIVLSVALPAHFVMTVAVNDPTITQLLDFSPVGYLKLYYQASSLFLVTILIAFLPKLSSAELKRLLTFYYVIFAASIVVEWLLVNVMGVSNSLMPAFKDSYSYYLPYLGYYRPFGLTGNPSVNGCILVAATWVMAIYVRPSAAKYYLAVTLGVLLLNNSGQAFLTYILSAVLYYSGGYKRSIRIVLLLAGACATFAIIYVGIFSKLSLDYVLDQTVYLSSSLIGDMDTTRILLGGFDYYKDRFGTTEVYFVYAVERFGVILTILTWVYVWLRLPVTKKGVLYVALFVGCVHYGEILYIPLQVLLALLFVYSKEVQLASLCVRTPPRYLHGSAFVLP